MFEKSYSQVLRTKEVFACAGNKSLDRIVENRIE